MRDGVEMLPTENDFSRAGFAEFIRRLAANKVGAIEWQRFIVEHYRDELLETARRSNSRLEQGRDGGNWWSDSEIAVMQHWSRRLKDESKI